MSTYRLQNIVTGLCALGATLTLSGCVLIDLAFVPPEQRDMQGDEMPDPEKMDMDADMPSDTTEDMKPEGPLGCAELTCEDLCAEISDVGTCLTLEESAGDYTRVTLLGAEQSQVVKSGAKVHHVAFVQPGEDILAHEIRQTTFDLLDGELVGGTITTHSFPMIEGASSAFKLIDVTAIDDTVYILTRLNQGANVDKLILFAAESGTAGLERISEEITLPFINFTSASGSSETRNDVNFEQLRFNADVAEQNARIEINADEAAKALWIGGDICVAGAINDPLIQEQGRRTCTTRIIRVALEDGYPATLDQPLDNTTEGNDFTTAVRLVQKVSNSGTVLFAVGNRYVSPTSSDLKGNVSWFGAADSGDITRTFAALQGLGSQSSGMNVCEGARSHSANRTSSPRLPDTPNTLSTTDKPPAIIQLFTDSGTSGAKGLMYTGPTTTGSDSFFSYCYDLMSDIDPTDAALRAALLPSDFNASLSPFSAVLTSRDQTMIFATGEQRKQAGELAAITFYKGGALVNAELQEVFVEETSAGQGVYRLIYNEGTTENTQVLRTLAVTVDFPTDGGAALPPEFSLSKK